MPRTQTQGRDAVTVYNVDWPDYRRFTRFFDERPGFRLTYDRGRLEIMAPSLDHENPTHLLGEFVLVLADVFDVPLKFGGSVTIRKRGKQRGLEPDRCFWTANEAAMRAVYRLDLRIHPPPDLALEIDSTSSSLNRMSIYADLGVPEVWRLKRGLAFHRLDDDGQYRVTTTSLSFPKVTAADLEGFLALRGQGPDSGVVRQFRAWATQLALDLPGGSP